MPNSTAAAKAPGTTKPPFVFRGVVLPSILRRSLDAYAEHHIKTGGFLRAVLEHDLFDAVFRADSTSLEALPAIVAYVYHELPSECHGSPSKVGAWLARQERP